MHLLKGRAEASYILIFSFVGSLSILVQYGHSIKQPLSPGFCEYIKKVFHDPVDISRLIIQPAILYNQLNCSKLTS